MAQSLYVGENHITTGMIPIHSGVVGSSEVNAVDARVLHEKLKVGKDFSNWIKDRIRQCNFSEGQDFIWFANSGESTGRGGDRRSKEYWLTLDAAKHISMLERNEVGFMIRQYFIDFEKKAMIGQKLKAPLHDEAKKRQVAAGGDHGNQHTGGKVAVVENLPQAAEKGQARDQAAALVGVSGRLIDMAKKGATRRQGISG